jgi:hypothetical protein
MKKIFTLLFAVGSITLVSAQSTGHRNSSNNAPEARVYHASQQSAIEKNNSYGYEDAAFSFREKEAQIRNINRAFDRRIAEVRRSRFLRNQEKAKQVRMLETQRSIEIRQVQVRYEKSNGRYADRGYDRNNSRKW